MHEDVPAGKAAVLLVRLGNDMMMLPAGQLVGLLPVLHKAAEHPEQRMYPEYGKGAYQEAGHGDEGVEEDRIFLAVVVLAMGIEFGKEPGRLGVAFGAGRNQVGGVDAGFGI